MAKVRNTTGVDLGLIRAQLSGLEGRRAELLEELAQIDAVSELLRKALAVGSPETPREATAPRSAEPRRSKGASKSGEAEQPTTRELILQVLATLPPGTQITTAALRTRLANERDYRPRLDTLRRSAQRMANRGELIRVDHKTWATLSAPQAGDATS